MSSLAYTDGFLTLVCLWVLARASLPLAVRMAAAVLGAAALLGVLRFSGLYPLVPWHQFASLMGASVAFPLLAVALAWPDSAVAQRLKFAVIFAVTMAVLGLLLVGVAQKRMFLDVLTVLSVLALLAVSLKRKWWASALASACMLTGLLLFAAKFSAVAWLVPGDFLHIGVALGLFGLAHSVSWPMAPLDDIGGMPPGAHAH